MDNETFDNFLDDATHIVYDLWRKAGGTGMSGDGMDALNDMLTEFFGDKRENEE